MPVVVLAMAGTLLVVMLAVAWTVSRWIRTPVNGTALILKGARESRVSFTRVLAIPAIHQVEVLDMAVHTIEVERRGREGLLCRDNIRADVRAVFLIRVNRTVEDVLKVAESIGCGRAGDHAALVEMFGGKFVEALRNVAVQLHFEELSADRERYKDTVIEVIGRDLNGFILDDVAIESIEQTPIGMLDPDNILDAEGIRKITERTAIEKIKANEARLQMERELSRQNLRAAEERMRLEAEQAHLEAELKRR